MNNHHSSSRALPADLEPLTELALDLRWTWCHEADRLWRRIDGAIWDSTRNPWLILQQLSQARLEELARDPTFRHELASALTARHRYGLTTVPWAGAGTLKRPVVYFCMEYGVGEALPLYAGGLGVLAGDHLKAASDRGLPLVAIGLLYQQGYFRQTLDAAGRQEEVYPYNDPTALPIQPALTPSGSWMNVSVDLPGRSVDARIWQAKVGRVNLYLLDSNLPTNQPIDRGITGRLYGDQPEMRLRQELLLGIGGWRVVEALGIEPGACHLNEGHTAFAVLERARQAMRTHRLSFRAALIGTRAGNVFTTHTSVAAGFDVFPRELMARYFPEGRGYLAELGIGFRDLMALGNLPGREASEAFRPAYLAMRGAARINAVSALHGETSRHLFQPLFPRWPEAEVPVSHVTNGVHVPSWDSRFADELWTAACGRDRWRGAGDGLETSIAAVDDRSLWNARAQAREALVQVARTHLAGQLARRGAPPEVTAAVALVLDPDILTLGFARRFAGYKRPNLLLRDHERLRRLLTNQQRPVQLLIAGKAHPDDEEGKALVTAWIRFAAEPDVRARCVFLEDYDLALAQDLVQGVDVWINTPRRPWEACGTSGMKVLVNGGLNLSVLDGWWAEAYRPDLGWALPPAQTSDVDGEDARALFELLENEVVPCFYERNAAGLPVSWLRQVRASLSRLTPRFSANRMLAEYVSDFYGPAEAEVERRLTDGGAGARDMESWLRHLDRNWSALRFGRIEGHAGSEGGRVSVEVFIGDLSPEDIDVELFANALPGGGPQPTRVRMRPLNALVGTSHGYLYGAGAPDHRPLSDYTPRIVPASSRIAAPAESLLILWHH